MAKRKKRKPGPKPSFGETMVTVSLRAPRELIARIDAAVMTRRRETKNHRWSRCDEIRKALGFDPL